MPSPSLAVFKDQIFLDELYRRLAVGAVSLELINAGEGFAHIRVVSNTRKGPYGFETFARVPLVAPL